MMLFGFVGLTATVVSFCGVVQPRFEKPELFVWSPTMASTFVVVAYGFAVANCDERQRPAARIGESNGCSSSSPCAHGALIVGLNFQIAPFPADAVAEGAIVSRATTASATQTRMV